MAVQITRMELDAAGLRRAAGQTHDADAARRMLALALVLDGHSRIEAATLCGMDRQTLRDWVHRYNEFGLPGLSNQVSPGLPCRLTPEQEAEVARLAQEVPDLAAHGVIRWRRIDLSRVIAARFGVQLRNVVSAICCAALGSGGSRRSRAIRGAMPQLRRRIKNFPQLVADVIPEHGRSGANVQRWSAPTATRPFSPFPGAGSFPERQPRSLRATRGGVAPNSAILRF